jgi:flagellar hook assembly protein FlgD
VTPKSEHVSIGIYDLAGRRVTTVFAGSIEAGVHSLRWDGRADGGRKLPAGAYFVKLQNGSQQTSKKLMISH